MKRAGTIVALIWLLPTLMDKGWAGDADWLARVRADHPRMFINKEILETVRAKARGDEKQHFAKLKKRIDGLLGRKHGIAFHVYECTIPEILIVGYVTGDPQYRRSGLKLFKQGVDWVVDSYRKSRKVSWFSYARIALYMAYDWLYDDLTPEERRRYGKALMQNVVDINDTRKKKISGENYYGFPSGGFYGVQNLYWYAGLAFHGDGIDDGMAVNFLRKGYENQFKMAAYRRKTAGDDGGMSAIAFGYVFGAYPRAEWNFFHTFYSATGENIAPKFGYLPGVLNWIVWTLIKDGDRLRYHGSGDVGHWDNGLTLNNTHLVQIRHFYAKSHPEHAALAQYLMDINPTKNYGGYFFSSIYPLLLKGKPGDVKPKGPDGTWPRARFFEYLGQVYMRTGFTRDDTYVLFTAGATAAGHKHFDENNFVIYRNGFLALDTGTRDHGKHTTNYYARTVAHNCMLMRMPGEKSFHHHWGKRPEVNDGGQNKTTGSKVLAFDTNEHYSYVASDATAAYSSKKAALVLRQFLFIHPDLFVILDRVRSKDKAFGKTWLLHTQNEPLVEGNTFRADEGEGRIFCRTLLPEDARLTKVGGPGKSFFVDGRNYPVAKKWEGKRKKRMGDKPALYGFWRVEVSPVAARKDDLFLHVIQVGDKAKLKSMSATRLRMDGQRCAVHIEDGEREIKIWFSRKDPARGGIEISQGGKRLVKENLPDKVKPQSGITGKAARGAR